MRVRAVLFSVAVLLAMLVVSAAQRTREGITSPRVLDWTLAPRPHEFWSLLCSKIPPMPCTALAPGSGRRPQVDQGVGGNHAAHSHTSCEGSRLSEHPHKPVTAPNSQPVGTGLSPATSRPGCVCSPASCTHQGNPGTLPRIQGGKVQPWQHVTVTWRPGGWNIPSAQLQPHSAKVAALGHGLGLGLRTSWLVVSNEKHQYLRPQPPPFPHMVGCITGQA